MVCRSRPRNPTKHELKNISHYMMKKIIIALTFFGFIKCYSFAQQAEKLIYHDIKTDKSGYIIPWYNDDLAIAYDHNLHTIWSFWFNMRRDMNGLPYYMNHQVWRPQHDKRGLGGDQLMMALSSWDLLYNYTGNTAIVDNMKYMADYYLSHGFTTPGDAWPDIPYPYNTALHSGRCHCPIWTRPK